MNATTRHSYHESAAWVSEGTVGAWTLVVGRFDDGTFCVDHYNRYDGRRTRHYFTTRAEVDAYVTTWMGKVS